MASSQRTIGLIGFGAFGRFMAPHLAPHVDLRVSDVQDISVRARALGVTPASIDEAARCDIVVLAVPVQSLALVLAQIATTIKPEALVIDVCSVKLEPLAMMADHLPPTTSILGLHPLFGPQSGKDGIAGLPIAICPKRITPELLAQVRAFLADTLGLRIIETTPEAHDQEMAYVQGLTHFLSRALAALPLPETAMSTRAYERFLAMKADLHADSLDLFLTIERHNPYAADARASLVRALSDVESIIKGAS
jgi:prephenate dehydrogenase